MGTGFRGVALVERRGVPVCIGWAVVVFRTCGPAAPPAGPAHGFRVGAEDRLMAEQPARPAHGCDPAVCAGRAIRPWRVRAILFSANASRIALRNSPGPQYRAPTAL